mmetsp:Transcript_102421/g.328336  ORF Transcript_102421/g.328336 Transcript_102421/m.328336 type:complete len:247 (+) Transcript_102421:1042-1782(+)
MQFLSVSLQRHIDAALELPRGALADLPEGGHDLVVRDVSRDADQGTMQRGIHRGRDRSSSILDNLEELTDVGHQMLASISAELLNGLAGCLRYLWNLPDEPLNRGGQLRPERSLEVRPTSPQQYGSCFALLDRRNLCTEDGLHDKLVDIGERRLICKRFGDAAEGVPEYLHSVPVLGRLGSLQRLLEQRQHPGCLGAAGGDAEHVHHDVLLRLAELAKRGGVLGVRRIPSAEPRQRGHTSRAELPE